MEQTELKAMREFLDAVGRVTLARKLGVTPEAVSMAIGRGRFPPAWWAVCEDLGAPRGLKPRRSWFAFRRKASGA